jgi:hypothetical protein
MNRRLQLEMPLASTAGLCRRRAPRPRMTRARWWFSQMHLAVEQASDWQPKVETRPTEILETGGAREVSPEASRAR